jgi:hypothetical protein
MASSGSFLPNNKHHPPSLHRKQHAYLTIYPTLQKQLTKRRGYTATAECKTRAHGSGSQADHEGRLPPENTSTTYVVPICMQIVALSRLLCSEPVSLFDGTLSGIFVLPALQKTPNGLASEIPRYELDEAVFLSSFRPADMS